jgi:diguanylate cyclase (GGDEF)-like protein
LNACAANDGFAARLGGDEFAVLLRGMSVEEARSRLQSVIDGMRLRMREIGAIAGISVGIARFASGFLAPEDLIQAADQACYEAKRAGRNQVVTSA